ncbi:RDD family protein [Kordia algicida OT-1]|uniref:Putative transmembrane protein n=1 Tax=Kordia algicida OT-1 TaxID=391587 RepID=A9E696_9FLAO|nr:RDD family protein [Kordia algicida]EDP94993.1 putative transmembrane protein [Kordia algicida OT-1]
MSEIQINTTQNVNINFTLASVGERVVAHIIDLIIKFAYGMIVIWIFRSMFDNTNWMRDLDDWSLISIYIILLFPAFVYTLVLESLFEGQTLGKKVMKIRVVKIDGYQASFVDYLIRWVFRIVDLNMLSGFIALISVIVTEKGQRLGDMTAGTSVISLKNRVLISHTILEEIGDNYKPLFPSVIKLSDNDMRIIKETFVIAKRARDYDTLNKLRAKVEEVIEIRSDQDTIPFIDVIIKDYNFYTQNM